MAIRCKPNTAYTISGGDRAVWRFEDTDGDFISHTPSTHTNVTTPSNAHRMFVYYSSTGTHVNVQVEESATATPYEPHLHRILHSCW